MLPKPTTYRSVVGLAIDGKKWRRMLSKPNLEPLIEIEHNLDRWVVGTSILGIGPVK